MAQSSSWTLLLTALIAGLFALIGGFVGAYTTSTLNFRNQLKITSFQKRQQGYAEIMGVRFLLPQLYVSRFEARIFSDYHEQLWHLRGAPRDSFDFQETQRWMHKSEDLALEIAKTNKELFESVGLVRGSFKQSAELDALTERVYHFRTPAIGDPPQTNSAADLETWKTTGVAQLQRLVEQEYAEPIDQLLEYLRAHINDGIT